MTLEERVIGWREAAVQQGVEQGLRQGVERGLRQGVERGLRQGREEGIDRERVLLRRLAAERFGADTAERVFALLAREDDPRRLDAIGVAIVRSETGDELLQQARRPFPNAHAAAGPNDVGDH